MLTNMIKKYKLEKGDKESYLKIRELYNSQNKDLRDTRLLYLLILFELIKPLQFFLIFIYK